jgi:hypothetical protein
VGERKKDLLWLETNETVSTESSEIASAFLKHFQPTYSNSSLGRDFSLPNQSMEDLRLSQQ